MKKVWKYLIAIVFTIIGSTINAQPVISWVNIDTSNNIFGGTGTFDNKYLVVGQKNVNGFKQVLTKYSCNGLVNWEKIYGDSRFWNINETTDLQYVIVGDTASGIRLTKTDTSGTIIWERGYTGGVANQHGYSVDNAGDGGYIVLGQEVQIGPRIVKTDSLGIAQWDTTFYGYGDGLTIIATGNNTYTFLCYIIGTGINLVKLDSVGHIIWQKNNFGGVIGGSWGEMLCMTTDNGFAFTGRISGNAALFKTDSAGVLQWSKPYWITGNGHSVQQTSDGGYILSGKDDAFNGQNFIIKTDMNGDTLWTHEFGNLGSIANVVFQTPDSGYFYSAYGRYDTTITAFAYNYSIKFNEGNSPCLITGLNEQTPSNEIKLFPNPSSKYFSIEFSEIIFHGTLEVYDVLGNILISENILNQTEKEINTKNISSGLYFVKVFDGKNSYCKKLIVEHD